MFLPYTTLHNDNYCIKMNIYKEFTCRKYTIQIKVYNIYVLVALLLFYFKHKIAKLVELLFIFLMYESIKKEVLITK